MSKEKNLIKEYFKVDDMNQSEKTNDYPDWVYKTKQLWLRNTRKRWVEFRKHFKVGKIRVGSAYYPQEVYEWLSKFEEMDSVVVRF